MQAIDVLMGDKLYFFVKSFGCSFYPLRFKIGYLTGYNGEECGVNDEGMVGGDAKIELFF